MNKQIEIGWGGDDIEERTDRQVQHSIQSIRNMVGAMVVVAVMVLLLDAHRAEEHYNHQAPAHDKRRHAKGHVGANDGLVHVC